MQFDPVTAQTIRELELAKARAVESEDYDLVSLYLYTFFIPLFPGIKINFSSTQMKLHQAKQLKDQIDQLKSIGVQLAQLESEKKRAVQEENYDRAKVRDLIS